jgi:dinuclear metal center YbgI/SA1388 family protein
MVNGMTTTVDDVIRVMEHLAPPRLAEKWDNIGLQVGQRDWLVNSIWIALDPLPDVVAAACREKVNLLITHHPLIFNPLRTVNFTSPVGRCIRLAAQNRLSIYAAHTNYDSVSGGLNDILARRIGLKNLRPLVGGSTDSVYKLVVFVPEEHEKNLLDALIDTGAGVIGAYRSCSFRVAGKATFISQQDATPYRGRRGSLSEVAEVRIESMVSAPELARVVDHLKSQHPYETMAYDVYPLAPQETHQGIGRWGELSVKTDLKSLTLQVKKRLGLTTVNMVGEPDLRVKKVAICTGSGGSLVARFLASPAEAFISGDLRYHEARDVQAARRGLVDIGHFASEHIMVPELTKQLRAAFATRGLKVNVSACTLESNPFVQV